MYVEAEAGEWDGRPSVAHIGAIGTVVLAGRAFVPTGEPLRGPVMFIIMVATFLVAVLGFPLAALAARERRHGRAVGGDGDDGDR